MKRIILSIFLLLSISSLLFSQNNQNGISLVQSGRGYTIEFNLPAYNQTYVDKQSERFTVLDVAGFGITSQQGRPMLPQVTFNLLLGRNEDIPDIEILSKNKETKYLSSKIFPTQAPWEKNRNLDDRPFTIDRGYYTTKGSIEQPLVAIGEQFVIAGLKGVTITITPFAYDPSANRIDIVNSAVITINRKSPTAQLVTIPVAPSFDGLYKNFFINYPGAALTPTNNYLIITAPEFEATMGLFAAHKLSMGYNVLMVNTGTTGTTNSAILSYIQTRYNNIATRPEFILLVGDIDKIPNWIGTGEGTPNTDLNYSLLEGGDAFADAFIGRFSIATTAQLTNAINKTIFMEQSINGLPKKNIFMASNDNYAISEGTHNFVIDSFFAPAAYTNVKLYTHTYSATTQQLIDALNANQTFAIYSGHGSETGWADGPVLNQSQVNALTNTVYPYVYGFACVTGSYQISECFAETWQRTGHGASVYWGSSVNSYWDEDDILERRLIRSMFTLDLKKTAPMMVMAKYLLVQNYGSVTPTMRRYLEMYNCFGDPSIYQATYGPMISHTPLNNTENLNGPYVVNCTITPAGSAIDPAKTKLFWTRGAAFADSILMTNISGNNWTASIPGNGVTSTYKYYLKTGDALNRICTLPGGAPSNYFTFNAAADVQAPVITHTQLGNVGQPMWPATVSCTATDNIGLDSVWVEWYKNSPSPVKQFRLLSTGGNNFAALFNSINSEVSVGDSIMYRIKARDNSSSHNVGVVPAAGYYRFDITSLTMTSFCKDTYVPIRDNQSSYDTLYIPQQGVIIDFNFKMESLIHTYDGDVSFSIKSPSGQEVILSANHGSGGENYTNTVFDDSAATPIASGTAPFTGTFKPDNPMTVFNGQNINGNWILKVTDNAGSDTGRVNRYCLAIQYTSILGIAENQIPVKFELRQNYPNPFNPVTRINYSVPRSTLVKLAVYDILGREVSILVNEMKNTGNYAVDFDASRLASGVYFYRIEAGDFTDVKKMVFIK